MKTLKCFKGLLLITLSIFSMQAFATPQQLLSNLHKLRLLSSESLINYYMYSGLDADSKYGKKVINSLGSFTKLLEDSRLLPAADGISDSLNEIDLNWVKFQRLMSINYNDMEVQGFSDLRLVDEMGKTNAVLNKSLSKAYHDVQISSGTTPSAVVETARNLAMTMEEITAQYTARGTSSVVQVSTERTLEQMAVEFRTNLAHLKEQANLDSSTSILRSIDSKWSFMERSIKNYNENTVPFLVASYSERIISNLEELVAMYDL
jgi:hypothetical protein